MAIKGSLAEATLSDVIQLLSLSLKSGCLSVTDGKNFGNIFIRQGKIIYATLLNRKLRLGDILIAKRIIDQDMLERALEQQKRDRKRLGEILIQNGSVKPETINAELRELINETIFTMLTWETGYFNFEADLLPSADEFTVELSPQEILLEGARRIDEWHKIENKIPSFDNVLQIKSDAVTVALTESEQKIMALIDGNRTIDEILKLSEFDFFETCRIIYGLLSAGLLEKPAKPATIQKNIGNITEYKNLGFAFYKTEMFEEAQREYRKVLEIDPLDAEALFYSSLIECRLGNYPAMKELLMQANQPESRFSVLNNLGFAAAKTGNHEEARRYLEAALKQSPDYPKALCNLSIVHYLCGDFNAAAETFNRLIEKYPELMIPYHYLPIIRYKQGDLPAAIDLLRAGIEKFPRLSSLKNNLALIYESIDKPEEAEKYYRQALEDNPRNEKIIRNLADFYYEAQILGAARELYDEIPEPQRDWEIYFKLGNIFLRQGDMESALQNWERARQLNPEEKLISKNIEILQKTRGR